jgi:hypothetical protein
MSLTRGRINNFQLTISAGASDHRITQRAPPKKAGDASTNIDRRPRQRGYPSRNRRRARRAQRHRTAANLLLCQPI